MKRLYFGDCLDILKELHAEFPQGFIDLIYIDPPFNSKRDYNVLFESHDIIGDANAQKQAFADTWSNVSYIDTLNELQQIDLDLFRFLQTLDTIRISKSAVAYLTTMAIRIYYMHKVLTSTGSFYLHCDQTMSHYLKILCDLVFGKDSFRNEIVWKRTSAHNDPTRYGTNIDIILYYTKGDKWTWNQLYTKHDPEYIKRFRNSDLDGRLWQDDNLSAKGLSGGGYTYTYKGATTLWRVPLETMERLDSENKLHFTNTGGIRLKRYLEDTPGVPLQTLWVDIPPINSQAAERLGYPTQKPEALLERIILTSSNEGDIVADLFCGCGTAVVVADRTKRNWLGVDISHLAIALVKERLISPFRASKAKVKQILDSIETHGLPKDIGSARELAANVAGGRIEFQDWVIEVMLGGVSNIKKSADGGFDGYLTFNISDTEKELALIEVKSGNLTVKNIREFIQVVDANKASLGAFVCFADQITKPMELEAKKQGYFRPDIWKDRYPKIQLITVEDLFDGARVQIPESTKTTFKKAKEQKSKNSTSKTLFDE